MFLFFSGAYGMPLDAQVIDGIKKLYAREHLASKNYISFSEKAKSEKFNNISRILRSISASESIHARNIKNVLSGMGVEVKEPETVKAEISDTRTNLGNVLTFELYDIDHTYPEILEKISPDGNDEVIRILKYAWESEKQHRRIISLMKSATETDTFFGMLSSNIENRDAECFVCMICGSSLMELPEETCPVCGNPASNYKSGY